MEFFIVYNFFLSTIQKLEEKEKKQTQTLYYCPSLNTSQPFVLPSTIPAHTKIIILLRRNTRTPYQNFAQPTPFIPTNSWKPPHPFIHPCREQLSYPPIPQFRWINSTPQYHTFFLKFMYFMNSFQAPNYTIKTTNLTTSSGCRRRERRTLWDLPSDGCRGVEETLRRRSFVVQTLRWRGRLRERGFDLWFF